MGFVYLLLYFVVVDNAITLFNCFFCDFLDFQVFNLALKIKHRFSVNKLAKKHNGDSRTCVNLYFTKHFLELSYHFFSISKGRILDELRVSLIFKHMM